MRLPKFVIACTVIAIASCQHGLLPRTFPTAYSAVGAKITYSVQGERRDRRGELFAVDTIGVTVYAGELTRVHWDRLASLGFDQLDGSFDIRPDRPVTAEHRAKITLLSRFPQGLSGPLLAQVLSTLKLERIEELP